MTTIVNSTNSQVQFILKCLHGKPGGLPVTYFAGLLGREAGAESNRQHSKRITLLLKELEDDGILTRVPDKKPVHWKTKES